MSEISIEENSYYPFRTIEPRWQAAWQAAAIHRAVGAGSGKPKYYVLDMFPYPSGAGLHVGHCKNYVPGDVFARFQAMRGADVLHPMGWDAFGQPAEQDAIKRGVNPRRAVPLLAAEYRRQMELLGLGYDWSREINSTDPSYYKWNQWAFLHLYEKGLAYRTNAPVNWCVNENTILANEEVVDGTCWRCDGPVVQRELPQWKFRITAYAEKLLEGLETIDWPEGVKTQQRDWIGKSTGVTFDFDGIRVFTTRVDTIFGVSFVVLSPEHPLVDSLTTDAQRAAVTAYRAKAAALSAEARADDTRERDGVFLGAHATNPISGAAVPVYIADYVLMGYGTGAIMAVPAHDTRDFDFARRYDLPTPVVVVESNNDSTDGDALTAAVTTKDGVLVNSGPYTGLSVKEAQAKITDALEADGRGERTVNYKLRDWLVSRQRYWGTPIPIVYCDACGVVPVPLDQLPVVLPDVENYKPGADGKSPLAAIDDFVHTTCPACGKPATRETDTLAGSVDSSWYFLRFTSPHESDQPWDQAAANYWMNVDMYLGGREHAVGHLLYARFFTKVFHDAGLVAADEPFQRLRNQGMLTTYTPVERVPHAVKKFDYKALLPDELAGYDAAAWAARFAEGGPFQATRVLENRDETVTVEFAYLKMSKGKRNAVTPDEIAARYGADALRLYVLFEAPFEDTIQWSEERMAGTFRFLNRVWDTVQTVQPAYKIDRDFANLSETEITLRRRTHQAIAKVTSDLEEFKFNTTVAELMKFADVLRKFVQSNGPGSPAAHEATDALVQLLAPLAPHLADELWERLGHDNAFLYRGPWPVSDATVAASASITLVVQVGGKVRDKIEMPADASDADCESAALASPKVQEALAGKTVRKVIVVSGKLVNLVAG